MEDSTMKIKRSTTEQNRINKQRTIRKITARSGGMTQDYAAMGHFGKPASDAAQAQKSATYIKPTNEIASCPPELLETVSHIIARNPRMVLPTAIRIARTVANRGTGKSVPMCEDCDNTQEMCICEGADYMPEDGIGLESAHRTASAIAEKMLTSVPPKNGKRTPKRKPTVAEMYDAPKVSQPNFMDVVQEKLQGRMKEQTPEQNAWMGIEVEPVVQQVAPVALKITRMKCTTCGDKTKVELLKDGVCPTCARIAKGESELAAAMGGTRTPKRSPIAIMGERFKNGAKLERESEILRIKELERDSDGNRVFEVVGQLSRCNSYQLAQRCVNGTPDTSKDAGKAFEGGSRTRRNPINTKAYVTIINK
jgi:hypothetical protein